MEREGLAADLRYFANDVYELAQQIDDTPERRQTWQRRIIAGLAINTAIAGMVIAGSAKEETAEAYVSSCTTVDCVMEEVFGDRLPQLPANPASVTVEKVADAAPVPAKPQAAATKKPAPAPAKAQPKPAAKKPAQVSLQRPQVGHLERKPNIPDRNLSLSEYLANDDLFIEKIPSLETLAAQFPGTSHFQNLEQKKSHIEQLDQEVVTSVEAYSAFAVDESRNRAFAGHPSYNTNINPKFFIIHWTAATHYADVDHFVRSMMSEKGNRKSVAYYIDDNAYHLVENDRRMTAHAKGVNDISQGVEIKAANLMDYKAHQLEKAVYLAVRFCRQNGLPVDATTIVSHSSVDLIYSNPHYDPYKGTFKEVQGRPPTMRKFDPPQELMTVLVRKAMLLEQQLGPR